MSRRRLWLFRLAAVVVGLSPFMLFEGLCIVFDWGRPSLHDDPFVGFSSVRPLFVLSDDETRREIPKARQTYFRPESFAAAKEPGDFRIFCLGGSTVQGRPFAIETSFTTWLEITLDAADPTRRWEVVNCGGASYASYRLVPIMEEVLAYEPDLIILYTGHNEFLEDRSFDHIKNRGAVLDTALHGASRLRTFTLMREAYLYLRGIPSDAPLEDRPMLPADVEALLDYRGGLEDYHRDEDWRDGAIAQYRFNLQRMVQMAAEAGVDIILVNPVSNLRDTPPFKSEHRGDLTAEQRQQWESLCDEARLHLRADTYNPQKAASLFEQACRIDPLHAGTFYTLAGCYDASGQPRQARDAYAMAKELDVCPLRILQPMNDAVIDIGREAPASIVDAQALFEQRSRDGVVGDCLVDHVHPGIRGHQLLADALADELVSLGLVRPSPGWNERKEREFQRHLGALDDLYFFKGKQRLEALRNWAAGRSEQIRSE